MKKETVKDDFYKTGPELTFAKPQPKRRRRSSADGQFDVEKERKRRARNRGINRVLRRLRRHQDFRMKILWSVAGILVSAILFYAAMQHMKWSRIGRLPPEERAAAMQELIEKNRQK
ncbi:hypothetical protein ACFLQY_02770 [Verrucomicrobiota bacterium]